VTAQKLCARWHCCKQVLATASVKGTSSGNGVAGLGRLRGWAARLYSAIVAVLLTPQGFSCGEQVQQVLNEDASKKTIAVLGRRVSALYELGGVRCSGPVTHIHEMDAVLFPDAGSAMRKDRQSCC